MTIYEEYAKAKQAIILLQNKIKELEPKILDEIKVLSEPMRTEAGVFTIVKRISWKFSPKITTIVKNIQNTAKESIQIIEDEARSKGEAEISESKSVRFIGNKEKK